MLFNFFSTSFSSPLRASTNFSAIDDDESFVDTDMPSAEASKVHPTLKAIAAAGRAAPARTGIQIAKTDNAHPRATNGIPIAHMVPRLPLNVKRSAKLIHRRKRKLIQFCAKMASYLFNQIMRPINVNIRGNHGNQDTKKTRI